MEVKRKKEVCGTPRKNKLCWSCGSTSHVHICPLLVTLHIDVRHNLRFSSNRSSYNLHKSILYVVPNFIGSTLHCVSCNSLVRLLKSHSAYSLLAIIRITLPTVPVLFNSLGSSWHGFIKMLEMQIC